MIMAYYDYQCQKCNTIKTFEFKMGQAPSEIAINCCDPEMKKTIYKRIFSKDIGLKFVGNGFYVNDYKDNHKGKGEE
jgi:predicted nucleic acid-binding Zn ribbon protein